MKERYKSVLEKNQRVSKTYTNSIKLIKDSERLLKEQYDDFVEKYLLKTSKNQIHQSHIKKLKDPTFWCEGTNNELKKIAINHMNKI